MVFLLVRLFCFSFLFFAGGTVVTIRNASFACTARTVTQRINENVIFEVILVDNQLLLNESYVNYVIYFDFRGLFVLVALCNNTMRAVSHCTRNPYYQQRDITMVTFESLLLVLFF